MALGPFDSFVFPGVYTRTLNEPLRATASGDLRIPAFIGVCEEQLTINNYELIRGSSSMADNRIVKENVSSQFDGSNRDFSVTYYPIVDGNGTGTVTNDPQKVIVYVNGEPVPVASVNGETGKIYLVNIPSLGDEVLVSYYFKRGDTYHEDENLTDQVNGTRKKFRVHYYPIVKGDNGGTPTSNINDIVVKVNNIPVEVESVEGVEGFFTLKEAVAIGDTLTVSYYSNELADTYDILPSPYVKKIIRVGYSPGTSDFVPDVDYVLDTTGKFNTIQWGHSYKIISGVHQDPASAYFDDSIVQVSLFDNVARLRPTIGSCDGTNIEFTCEFSPVDGDGRGKLTANPDKVKAYYGKNPTDSTEIDVISIDVNRKKIFLASPPPLEDGSNKVFVSLYYNALPDDIWTITDTTSGGDGTGTYTVQGTILGKAFNVTYSPSDTTVADPNFANDLANGLFPLGLEGQTTLSDARVIPGYGVEETVTLEFINEFSYTVSSDNPKGTGSKGDNTGYLNQTYIDKVTGFQVTILAGDTVYQSGDKIGFKVSSEFVNSSLPSIAIPSLKLTIEDTSELTAGDTAILKTFNKSGAEPNIGDFYYVSFKEEKQFDKNGLGKAKLYTLERDVVNDLGEITINNKLGLAAHLAFLNGSSAVILLPIKRAEGSADAPDSRYIAAIDYFNEPISGGIRPSILVPLTTSRTVLNYLKTSNVIQSSIRYANERYTWFGFGLNTTPSVAQSIAKSFNSERMMGVYPDGAITTVRDEYGNDIDYLVDGSLIAAAIAGRDSSPAFDVAEPLTRKPIVGFKRLYRRLDSVTAAQVANSGLTLLEESASGIDIKFAITTDVSSALTRHPNVVRTKDFVQRGIRNVLRPYIGMKNLPQRLSEIKSSTTSYFSALQQAQIITAYQNIVAEVDPNDPTVINLTAHYMPIFPLLWIVVTFNIRSSL